MRVESGRKFSVTSCLDRAAQLSHTSRMRSPPYTCRRYTEDDSHKFHNHSGCGVLERALTRWICFDPFGHTHDGGVCNAAILARHYWLAQACCLEDVATYVIVHPVPYTLLRRAWPLTDCKQPGPTVPKNTMRRSLIVYEIESRPSPYLVSTTWMEGLVTVP